MKRWWKRSGPPSIEELLRDARPDEKPDLIERLVTRIEQSQWSPRSRRPVLRAGVVTAATVVLLASFGGIGYAASVALDAIRSVNVKVSQVRAGAPPPRTAVVVNAALDQYSTTAPTTTTTSSGGGAPPPTTTATTTKPATTTAPATVTCPNGKVVPKDSRPAPNSGAFGDPCLSQDGPPSVEVPSASAKTRLSADKTKRVVTIPLRVDEPVALYIAVLGRDGKAVPFVATVVGAEGGAQGKPTKSLHVVVRQPGNLKLKLKIPAKLLDAGGTARVRLTAVDPSGEKQTTFLTLKAS
jgi:hypothetical protein